MKKFLQWYNKLTNRIKTSITFAVAIIGFISTVMSVAGVSLHSWTQNVWFSLLIIVSVFVLIAGAVYMIIGMVFKDSVSITIRQTPVSICYGDIFETDGWRIIGCDTHFDTRVDDVVISKKSLHGQLILNHGIVKEIKAATKKEAQRLQLTPDSNGLYNFPLGTVVRYNSSVDNHTYLMLAMTELDEKFKANTNMAKFEHMLMKMWSEIDRIYASNDLALPLLGTGISRFDDGPKDKEALLRCMLCTLNNSGVTLNSKVKVVIFGDDKDIPLYEYKDIFSTVQRR